MMMMIDDFIFEIVFQVALPQGRRHSALVIDARYAWARNLSLLRDVRYLLKTLDSRALTDRFTLLLLIILYNVGKLVQ